MRKKVLLTIAIIALMVVPTTAMATTFDGSCLNYFTGTNPGVQTHTGHYLIEDNEWSYRMVNGSQTSSYHNMKGVRASDLKDVTQLYEDFWIGVEDGPAVTVVTTDARIRIINARYNTRLYVKGQYFCSAPY